MGKDIKKYKVGDGFTTVEDAGLKEKFGNFSMKDIRKVVSETDDERNIRNKTFFSMSDIKKTKGQYKEKAIYVINGIKKICINGKLVDYDEEKHKTDLTAGRMPLFCPKCNSLMKKNRDGLAWIKNRSCKKCYIEKRQSNIKELGLKARLQEKIKVVKYNIDKLNELKKQAKVDYENLVKNENKLEYIMNGVGDMEYWINEDPQVIINKIDESLKINIEKLEELQTKLSKNK